MNVVFGIGIAVILFIVVMLGTQVFYKEPTWDTFNCSSSCNKAYPILDYSTCPDNITVKDCNLMVKNGNQISIESQEECEACNTRVNEAQKEYGKRLFIINNVAGIILVVISLLLFSMVNIAAGTAFAGLVLIIYGFMRGWQGTGDILKFIVALIVAAIFIYFAVFVNKRYNKSSAKKKK